MTIHPHLAVIGRLDGDDEDTCMLFERMAEEQAREAFRQAMRDGFKDNYGEVLDEEACPIYVNFVFVCDSPITILEAPYV